MKLRSKITPRLSPFGFQVTPMEETRRTKVITRKLPVIIIFSVIMMLLMNSNGLNLPTIYFKSYCKLTFGSPRPVELNRPR